MGACLLMAWRRNALGKVFWHFDVIAPIMRQRLSGTVTSTTKTFRESFHNRPDYRCLRYSKFDF